MDSRVERLLAGLGQLREQLLVSPLRVDLEGVNQRAQALVGELSDLQGVAAELPAEDAQRLAFEVGRVQALFRAAAGAVLAWPVEKNYTAAGELSAGANSSMRVEA